MTVLISDLFTGMGNGEDINGRTPVPTNTPGDTWEAGLTIVAPALIEGDGAGQIKTNDAAGAWIDTGIINQKVSVDFNAGDADNRATVIARANDFPPGHDSCDHWLFNMQPVNNIVKIFKRVDDNITLIGAIVDVVLGNNTQYKYTFEVNGNGADNLKGYVDDVLEITRTDASIDGSTEGGSYAGFTHGLHTDDNARFDNFLVEDFAVGEILFMDALTGAGSAGSFTQSSGAVALAMDALSGVGSAELLTQASGAVQIIVDALNGVVSAGQLTQVSGAVQMTMDALSGVSSAENLTQVSGAVQLVMDALSVATSAETVTQVLGAIQLVMNALTATTSAETISVSALGLIILMNVLSGVASAENMSLLPGEVQIALDALAASMSAEDLVAVVFTLSLIRKIIVDAENRYITVEAEERTIIVE